MAFTVKLSYGKDKLNLELPSSQCSVGELKELVSSTTGVPPPAQKIIFRGRTLQNDEASLEELKVSNNSKMILLGRRGDENEGEYVREISKINKAVDAIKKKIDEIEEEVDGMEKGFLQAELIAEACRGLHKRCVSCNELLMQNTEKLDAVEIPPSETLVRTTRKTAIRRIQLLLERTDKLESRVGQCRTAGTGKTTVS